MPVRSQQHLLIVNGNIRGIKYARVTAVMRPGLFPYIKEVSQHFTRILQLTLSMSWGDMDLIGERMPRRISKIGHCQAPVWEFLGDQYIQAAPPGACLCIRSKTPGQKKTRIPNSGPLYLWQSPNSEYQQRWRLK